MHWLKAIHRKLLPDSRDVGWFPYLWLVYLVFFFIRYYYVTPSLLEVAAVIATLAAFLRFYFEGHWKRGWPLLTNIIGIAALGLLWAPVNPGAGVMFIYAASFAGWLGPVRRAVAALVVIIASVAAVALLIQPHVWFWFPALLFGTLVGVINIHTAQQQRHDARLRMTQDEVTQLAQVAERERISRDLHDLLGHTLSVITLKSELAARLVARDPARAEEEMRGVERVSRDALADVREAVSGIRARGLAGEMEHVKLALKAASVKFEVEGEPPELPPASEAVFALVLREAVTNVIRHAQANRCRVAIRAADGGVLLEVQDDGRGGKIEAGSGIEGMRTRLASLGGHLEIAGEYGTRVRAWVPLEEAGE